MISTFKSIMGGCSTVNSDDGVGTPSSSTAMPGGSKELCSGRGECDNGTCICEIRYSGDECTGFNLPYHAGVSSVFYFVALFSLIQLLICVVAEYQRLKQPSCTRACRVTAQKLLYLFVFLAALMRGAYFTTPETMQPSWAMYLMSAYYPLLMTCASLVVCLWAEIFHLRDINWERSQFLSKSFVAFIAFNLLPYGLFGAEIITSLFSKDRRPNTPSPFFNGCYAALLLILVVFFLIYGVEVFFKVRGNFLYEYGNETTTTKRINMSQLHQSRFGLLIQAIMMILVVGFLASETLGDLWKAKVPVQSRNWYDILFRLMEVGVVFWFPCCLWNSMAPEQLWILNPRKLLTRQIDAVPSTSQEQPSVLEEENSTFIVRKVPARKECWICYDLDKDEPLISPCNCKGDTSSVHHECLQRWLAESFAMCQNEKELKCKVCDAPYEIERKNRVSWDRGFTVRHWIRTIIISTVMVSTFAVAWVVITIYDKSIIRVIAIGFSVIIGYVCVKLLSENTVDAYQRAKGFSFNVVADSSSHCTSMQSAAAIPLTSTSSSSSSTTSVSTTTTIMTASTSAMSSAGAHLDTISEHVQLHN